jgi:hypothetical protein
MDLLNSRLRIKNAGAMPPGANVKVKVSKATFNV